MSPLPASRLARKYLRASPLSWPTRHLVQKSCFAVRPSTAITLHAPKPLVRYTSTATPPTTWVDRFPARVRPYIYLTRIDKPIGTLLLFYPCGKCPSAPLVGPVLITVPYPYPAWSITMASYANEAPLATSLAYLGLFGLGALVMRGAGCTINDMWDMHLDKAVGEPSPFVAPNANQDPLSGCWL